MLSARPIPFCLFACLLAAGSQAPVEKDTAELTARDAPAAFNVKVNLVLVPVVARDRQGRAVGNLTKEDFQLFDKGKPQVITKFSVEKSGSLGAATSVAKKAPGQAEAPPAIPERYVVYLFDDVHLNFSDLARTRDAAKRHLSTSLEPTDRAAIYSTSGQTMLDSTDDRAKLSETLLRLRPRPSNESLMSGCPNVSYYMADLIQNKNDAAALDVAAHDAIQCLHLDPTNSQTLRRAQEATQQAASVALTVGDAETRLVLDVLKQVVRRASAMPGQRSIVLVSPGFFLSLDHLHDVTPILESAIHANVMVSALDARGLFTTGPTAAEGSQNSIRSQIVNSEYQRQTAMVQSQVMAELADGTGGTFFHNSNDLDEGFRRVAARPEYFYMLGFSPQNLKMDGRLHSLKVTLKDSKNLTLQARNSYYAPTHMADPAEEAKREIEDALFSRDEMHDLPVDLRTQFFKSSEATAKISVLAHVDVKQIRFRKADGRNRNDLTIVSGLFDRNGVYIAATEKVVQMRLRDETLANKLGSGITVKTSFDVKPGSYAVRLVVRDAEGHLMSAENAAVEIP